MSEDNTKQDSSNQGPERPKKHYGFKVDPETGEQIPRKKPGRKPGTKPKDKAIKSVQEKDKIANKPGRKLGKRPVMRGMKDSTPGKDNKPLQWQVNHGLIKKAFYTFIKGDGRPPSIAQVAEKVGMQPDTVANHLKHLKFDPVEHPLRILTDDVLLGIAQSAQAGNSGSQKLWLQVMEGWSEKDPTLGRDEGINLQTEDPLKQAIINDFLRKLPIIEIVIQKIAQKRNIQPSYLLHKLKSSFYAKHTGMVRPDSTLEEQPKLFPSSLIYNFDEIRTKAENRKAEDDEKKSKDDFVISLTDTEEKRVLNLKELALKKILELKSLKKE